MKRFILVCAGAVLLLLLPHTPHRANPILEGYFNELFFSPSGWQLEMHLIYPTSLDGWYITSRSGQASFRSGIEVGGVYRIITRDSLLGPLDINPAGDSLTICSPQFRVGVLMFGPGWGMGPAPRPHQSICLLEGGALYYLDNTPTLGLQNDGANAMGTVSGRITDTSGAPVSGVQVLWGQPFPVVTSDTGGRYSLYEYASNLLLTYVHPSFSTAHHFIQIWPESTVTLDVVLTRVMGAEEATPGGVSFGLREAYPNPFNPVVHLEMMIPERTGIRLAVYDVAGREVALLAEGEMSPGHHKARFDGSALAAGTYLVRLEAGARSAVRKILLLK
ncbi:MAG: T9SS type A sorting domain-containing protein [Bacteroidota bacterium]